MYRVYILRNSENKLYIGQTSDILERLKRHNSGNGADFTRKNLKDFKIVYTENYQTRTEAMQRESQLKRWSRIKKEALISGDLKKLKAS